MSRNGLDIVVSGVLVFVVGYLVWPPRHVYWSDVAGVIGSTTVWLVIIGLCVGFGYGVRKFTSIAPLEFAIGGVLAYGVGMALIEASMTPDSPVHLFAYGFLLACMVFGTAIRESVETFVALLDFAARN